MKVITLNVWNGRLPNELKEFFNQYSTDTDVFCLQEIFKAHNVTPGSDNLDTPEKIEDTLGEGYRFLSDDNGLMVCYKREHVLKDHGIVELFSENDFRKNLLWAVISMNDKDYLIGNVHGIWSKDGRDDTPERLKQSEIIRVLFDKYQDNKILCGDFNLLPDTKSVIMLEENMINLIRKNGITTTRTRFKKHTNLDKKNDEFADYIFISSNLETGNFKVLPDEASDHSPLLFSI